MDKTTSLFLEDYYNNYYCYFNYYYYQYNYYTITELSNTTTYYFKVSAANSMGYGPSVASSPSGAAPSLQKPGAATSLAVFESAGDTFISWAEPTMPWFGVPCNGTAANPGACPNLVAEGGSEVRSYSIYVSTSSSFNVATRDIEVSAETYQTALSDSALRLSSGSYYVRIFVTTAVGISPASETIAFTVA